MMKSKFLLSFSHTLHIDPVSVPNQNLPIYYKLHTRPLVSNTVNEIFNMALPRQDC